MYSHITRIHKNTISVAGRSIVMLELVFRKVGRNMSTYHYTDGIRRSITLSGSIDERENLIYTINILALKLPLNLPKRAEHKQLRFSFLLYIYICRVIRRKNETPSVMILFEVIPSKRSNSTILNNIRNKYSARVVGLHKFDWFAKVS